MKATMATLLVALSVIGCASTRISSQADISSSNVGYDTVMVIAVFGELDMRQLGESEMCRHLALHHFAGIPSSQMFFPGESFSDEQIAEKLLEHHVSGILVLSAYAAGAVEHYFPPTYYTRGTAWVSGDAVNTRSTTYTSGGATVRLPWAKFRAELIDLRTERRTWLATARSGGNAFASGHTLLRSFCGQVMNRLLADRAMRPRQSAGSRARR